jgi:VanZ family protein
MLVLTIGSLQPERPTHEHNALHRLFHFACFGILATLSRLVLKNQRSLLFIILACVILGVGLEFGQHLIYRIGIEWDDVRDDAIGAVAGAVVGSWLLTRRPR